MGPRARPRSDIGGGLIDRMMTKNLCYDHIDSAKKRSIESQHFLKVAKTCYHS